MKDELMALADRMQDFLYEGSFKKRGLLDLHGFSHEFIQSIVVLFNKILGKIYSIHEENKIFLENSAHELRNTLLGLDHYAAHFRVMNHQDIPEKSIRNFFYIISRTRHLTEYILLFSSLADQAEWHWKSVCLSQLIERESHLFVYHPYAARVSYDLNSDAEVFANPVALRFVIQNFILNALDAIDDKGSVLVRLVKEKDRMRLSIADNGKGLSLDQKKALYKKFCRVSKPSGSGLGVGFFLSQKIVTLHGGDIDIGAGINGQGVSIQVVLQAYR